MKKLIKKLTPTHIPDQNNSGFFAFLNTCRNVLAKLMGHRVRVIVLSGALMGGLAGCDKINELNKRLTDVEIVNGNQDKTDSLHNETLKKINEILEDYGMRIGKLEDTLEVLQNLDPKQRDEVQNKFKKAGISTNVTGDGNILFIGDGNTVYITPTGKMLDDKNKTSKNPSTLNLSKSATGDTVAHPTSKAKDGFGGVEF